MYKLFWVWTLDSLIEFKYMIVLNNQNNKNKIILFKNVCYVWKFIKKLNKTF